MPMRSSVTSDAILASSISTRFIIRVEIEDARLATDLTSTLMGTDVPPRRAFIYDHATDAELNYNA